MIKQWLTSSDLVFPVMDMGFFSQMGAAAAYRFFHHLNSSQRREGEVFMFPRTLEEEGEGGR